MTGDGKENIEESVTECSLKKKCNKKCDTELELTIILLRLTAFKPLISHRCYQASKQRHFSHDLEGNYSKEAEIEIMGSNGNCFMSSWGIVWLFCSFFTADSL